MNEEDIKKLHIDHWNRQQQCMADLHLLCQEQMLLIGASLIKVITFLCSAALLALVGAVEKGLISKVAAYWGSVAYLVALFLIISAQALSTFNMKCGAELGALLVNKSPQILENAIDDSELKNEINGFLRHMALSYWLGWGLGVSSAVIFFVTTGIAFACLY